MKKYLARRELDAGVAPWRWLSLPVALVVGALACFPAAAEDGDAPAPSTGAAEAPLCQLTDLARTALETAGRSMTLMAELEKAVEDRVSESKSAFKTCEQDEPCRASPRLRDLEDAFNQAHAQKQRMASAHAEAVQRQADLEARYKSLKAQAVEAGCQIKEIPSAPQ